MISAEAYSLSATSLTVRSTSLVVFRCVWARSIRRRQAGLAAGFKTLDIRLQIGDTYPGRALHMDQREPTR